MLHILTIVLSAFVLVSCGNIPPYDPTDQEMQARQAQNFNHFYHNIDDQMIHGVHVGDPSNPALIFIHGTPGDWKAWGQYLGDYDLSAHFFMMAFDRPGFGASGAGNVVLSLEAQANIILKAAQKEHSGPFISVGHSYGGPIQMQMAQNHPDMVSDLIVLAGPLDPVIQDVRWYHRLANTWLARKILPEPLSVAAKEMISLPNELQKLQSHLNDIQTPITLVQGTDDWLVPKGNIDYAKAHIDNDSLDIIILENQGHFLPWEQYDVIKELILNYSQ